MTEFRFDAVTVTYKCPTCRHDFDGQAFAANDHCAQTGHPVDVYAVQVGRITRSEAMADA